MNILVLLRMVPDVVEELVIAGDGMSLDADAIRLRLSEPDEHALEEAVLLKERAGGTVTAIALDAPDIDEVLFTAAAKGADRLVKLHGSWEGIHTQGIARLFCTWLSTVSNSWGADSLLLTGSQAIDDAEGELAALLSEHLQWPYIAVVTSVAMGEDGAARVTKEFAGGLRGEFRIALPAIVGVQSASKPPRYVPVAKVRAASKKANIESVPVTVPTGDSLRVQKLSFPQPAGKAEMLSGSPEEIAAGILERFVHHGIL